jgi:hypothetical protein
LTQYGLPEPARVEHEINMELDVFVNAWDSLLLQSQQSYDRMNVEQCLIYNRILTSILTGGCFFLDRKAGRGKTFLVNAICNYL